MQNDKSKITEMFSAQGEKVEMEHPVEAKGRLFRIFLNRLVLTILILHKLHIRCMLLY